MEANTPSEYCEYILPCAEYTGSVKQDEFVIMPMSLEKNG